ncbi:MAG TPA: 3-deoxy-D-manno-octulosonic acid transferase [Candidatus Acidoferrales bacterium]|nr:3-deoxy-D-manno-octulosonic acid transferase [Candidatus Acidoferrales bacterium]
MYFTYSFLMALGALVAAPYFFIKGLRSGKYLSNLSERFGKVPPELTLKSSGCIWIHAVSVGEVLAALPLAKRLKIEFPQTPLVISTTTATGQALAGKRIDFADGVFYFPFDWAWIVRRVIRAIKPACIIILETEIWPHFLRETRRANVPIVFANGRISDRSFRRHQRLLGALGFLARHFYKNVLANATIFLMQSETDADRVRTLGAPPERVVVTGNLKYDSPQPAATPLESWLASAVDRLGRRPLIVAGSVTSGEEPLVLIAFGVLQGQIRNSFLVLAPRKPERFDAAARHIEESHRKYVRRSQLRLAGDDRDALAGDESVLLLDSIGELAGLYGIADAVFIGGSLVPAGGHNLLEPAGFGKPPLFGPSMENFQEVASAFLARGAALQVDSPESLGVAWIELVEDAERNRRMGETARSLVEENRGATERTIKRIISLLPGLSKPAEKDIRSSAASSSGSGV